MDLRSVCVFCGSSSGSRPEYPAAARCLGEELLARGLELVYGGGNIGLMAVIADTVMQGGGRVTGVIPHGLERREVAHQGVTELRVVASMHERKATMASLSDAFISLPGGIGTFEEILEIITWNQLGIYCKPCGVINVCGFYDGLLDFLDHAAREGFMREETRRLLLVADDAAGLLDMYADYDPVPGEKWLDPDES